MTRTTLFFFGLSVMLAIATSVVVWQLLASSEVAAQPQVQGTVVPLGLPNVRPEDGRELFSARSALLYDTATGAIAFEQNGFERVPIASITKLMTAMVALDYGIDWDQQADIQLKEYVIGGRLLLHPGETVTMKDLFYASLLGSANNATLAYVRTLGITQDEFVRAMNRKAVEIGLEQTYFVEVTGLDDRNISTAYEVAQLAAVAFNQYPEIREATSRPEYTFIVGGSGREHTIRNTNKALSVEGYSFGGSKTGYLDEAQYCLVVQGAGEWASRIAVILGSPSEPGHFADIRRLLALPVP